MARIPFDDRVMTPKLQAAPQRSISGEAQAITGRAASRLTQQVGAAGQKLYTSYENHLKAQDEADMVKTRAAYLRMQKEENHAMQQTADPAEIQKINGEYKKKYDSLTSGNDSFGRPRFRNDSGKESFKKEFTDNFHLRRDLSAKEQGFQLDRRNTRAGFINGIKSIPESDYYDKPMAERETVEYVDKLVEHGYLTENEGAEKKHIYTRNLDIERAGRKLSEISAEPIADFNGTGVMNPVGMHVEQTKEYINNLENITDEQKKVFTKKADSILSNAQNATKAATKEREIQIKKDKRPLYEIFHDPKISPKFREKHLPKLAAKNEKYQKIIAAEGKSLAASKKAFETKFWNGVVNSKLGNKANSYDAIRHDDPSGSVATALIAEIYYADGMPSQLKTHLVGLIQNSSKVPPHIKEKKDNHIKDMERIFGLSKESFDVFKEVEIPSLTGGFFDVDKASIDPKTGERMVDGLNEFERRDALNVGMLEYNSLMNQGKEKEAEEYIIKYKTKYEKSENDTKLYSGYFKEVSK